MLTATPTRLATAARRNPLSPTLLDGLLDKGPKHSADETPGSTQGHRALVRLLQLDRKR